MSAVSTISIPNVELIATLCPAIALVATLGRLGLRIYRSGLWWDDAFALLSAIHIILASVGGWVHFMDPKLLTRTTRIAAYYVLSEAFYGTVWAARLSILFSVIRITPDAFSRTLLYRAAIVFGVVWAFFFAQLFWICVPELNWTDLSAPQCTLSLQVPVCQLVTDILADLLLITVPVRLFLGSSLESGMKIRLAAIFSASILTTVVSLVHAVYILKVGGVDELVAAVVEDSVSLIVCNLSVVVTALYRACGLGENVALAQREFKVSSLKFASFKSRGAPQASAILQNTDSAHGVLSTLTPGGSQMASSNHDTESTHPIDHSEEKLNGDGAVITQEV
ncbi:hypothetical protein JB92DRAFT_2810087 [Gautieria morchelliformis]|nr:hypothetical protein JB92DRAFT_2810087 [Gautieria morchelliformis]